MTEKALEKLNAEAGVMEALATSMAAQVMGESAKKMASALAWQMTSDPEDLRSFALDCNDTADHLEIAQLLSKAQVVQAGKVASQLETASRDKMPRCVWEFLWKYMVPGRGIPR